MTGNLAQLLVRQRPDLLIGVDDDQFALGDLVAMAAARAEFIMEVSRPGDRVAILSRNSADYLITWLGCLLAERAAALINPAYPRDLLAEMLGRLDPSVIFTDSPAVDQLRGIRQLPVKHDRSERSVVATSLPGLAAGPDALAGFMHTSGTSGVPKFCAQAHSYFLRLGKAIANALDLTSADRVYAPLPLFHINALGYGFVGALTAGADVLGSRRFSATGFWPFVTGQRITAIVMHAPPVEILKRRTTAADASGHRVRTMFYADREFMQSFGVGSGVSCYGSTEAAGVTHLRKWHVGEQLPDNVGRWGGAARDDVEWALSPDGEILIRGRATGTLFSGYFADGQINPSRDADKWFHTGDLGEVTPSGELIFVERQSEAIRVAGEYVPIQFVEDRFGAIAGLADVALWKRPGDLADDEVVLYATGESLPLEQIRVVAAELPRFMRPVLVVRIASMPRDSGVGKVRRRLLPGQTVLETARVADGADA